ncbi:MAG: prepilin-type N-terminal cleavage/methylation domain-containing protein [Gallionellaceae bacterium]
MFPSKQSIEATLSQRGFTLVEIMVAMAIGMLGIVIIMQMATMFDSQKRTTTGGDDAQNAGAIALFGLQQNIQQSGYCFSTTPPTLNGATLTPVTRNLAAINALKDANTDTILVSYGNDACAPDSASGVASATNLNVLAYAVMNGNLMQCDYLASNCAVAANWVQIASDIVSLKAQCTSTQSVRVALVVRSTQLEKTVVTNNAPTWAGASAIVLTGTTVDASATDLAARLGGNAWQYYRYKTFETVVPVRNTIWGGTAGCV